MTLLTTGDQGIVSLMDHDTGGMDLSVDSTTNNTEYLPPTISKLTSGDVVIENKNKRTRNSRM